MLLVAGIRLWNRPVLTADPQEQTSPRVGEMLDRLDPNTASWRRLAILPGLGEKRARAIEAYREAFRAMHEGERAFETAVDLGKVKGIGPATIENLRAYLIFPGEQDVDADAGRHGAE